MSFNFITSGVFSLTEILIELLKKVKITYRVGGVHIEFEEEKSIDERIAKIDEARTSMVEAIAAIDQLHKEAETNKEELKNALKTLNETEQNKSKLEKELKNIRQVMQSDVTTFKKMAGIPSKEEVKQERVLGFFTGVFASVVASGVIWLLVAAWPHIKEYSIETYKTHIQTEQTPNKALKRDG